MELAQRKEAAAKALLEREKKKAEQDKAEIERLKAELAAVTRENQELRQARDQALSKSSSMSSAVSSVQPVEPAKPEVRLLLKLAAKHKAVIDVVRVSCASCVL